MSDMNLIRSHLSSPALIVACLALVVSLGGVSYASGVLPGNSVGAKQLRKGAVKPSKVAPRTIALFKGQKGDPGPAGQPGAKGEPGPTGDTGPAGPFPAVLPTGKTLRGSYTVYGLSQGVGMPTRDTVSFGIWLPFAPQAHFVGLAGPANANCPGSPSAPAAAPGHLCVYEQVATSVSPVNIITITRSGAVLSATSTAAGGTFGSTGSWAVTGP